MGTKRIVLRWRRNKTGCFDSRGFSARRHQDRISDRFEDPRFVLSFREPVSRIFSHWRMVLDSGEAKKNGVDWSEFE